MGWLGFLYREIREVVAPISKEGIELNLSSSRGYTRATRFKKKRPEEYTPSTIIIHGKDVRGGYAKWELEIPKYVRDRLIDMTLRIETVRTHGMLHCPPDKKRSAEILVNGELLDRIYLVARLPHGKDFSVDSRRPIPVFRYIRRDRSRQTIKLWLEEDVFWDVDRVSLEPVIKRKEIKPEAAMIIGAIITALIGAFVGFYL